MKNFLLQLSILSIVSLGLYHLIGMTGSPYYFSWHPLIASFFFVVTMFFHKGLENSLVRGNQHFIRYYMGATAVKLMLILLLKNLAKLEMDLELHLKMEMELELDLEIGVLLNFPQHQKLEFFQKLNLIRC